MEGVAGSTLTLDSPVAAARGGFPERRVQAEVLNLQRAVTITGDDFDGARHGLHVVAHSLAEARVSYARVEKCGQLGVAGKYCLHFHQARACPSCLFLGNAIENSSQRGIIVHGTHRSRVEANVLYDIKGSGIYIEDGNEMENKIIDNVVLCPQKNNCKQPGRVNGGGPPPPPRPPHTHSRHPPSTWMSGADAPAPRPSRRHSAKWAVGAECHKRLHWEPPREPLQRLLHPDLRLPPRAG